MGNYEPSPNLPLGLRFTHKSGCLIIVIVIIIVIVLPLIAYDDDYDYDDEGEVRRGFAGNG